MNRNYPASKTDGTNRAPKKRGRPQAAQSQEREKDHKENGKKSLGKTMKASKLLKKMQKRDARESIIGGSDHSDRDSDIEKL